MNGNAKKLFGLGKGLGSLIPTGVQMQPTTQKENVFYVEVSKIEPNPNQPRRDFDADALKELSVSIRKYGVLQPLLVTKVETTSPKGLDVSYQLIAGERRLRAAKLAGLPHVPVIIRDDFEKGRDRLEVALIENVQREDLNPVEEAEAYIRLNKEFGLTQQEIATKVSKSREVVANAMRLLNLPEDMKEALRGGKLTRSHARALLAFNDVAKQREIYQQILNGGIISRDVESIASAIKAPSGRKKKQDSRFIELEKNLASTLGTLVSIQGGATTGGKILIKFASLEDLNKIAKSIID
jgi:ParB family transcriptional regulator, chromosome partitioning protein